MTITENQKKAIYKWRNLNKEKLNELHRNYAKTYYSNNSKNISINSAKRYIIKKEFEIFRNILL
jgi:hypothetical protein